MSDLGKRVGLVHELRQRVSSEERVDHRRYCLCVDKISRSEDLIVADIHFLADRTRYTRQSHTELVVELLANSTHTTVAEVVDIIDVTLGVDQLYKIFDDGYDILACENLHIHRSVKFKLLVDAIASHLSEVVTLLAEEEVLDNLACCRIIRRLRVTELTIDILHSLLLRVRGIFLESVENDAVVNGVHILLF